VKKWGDHWPFLSRDPAVRSTADFPLWDEYFRRKLNAIPRTYQFFYQGGFDYLNVPEVDPWEFDPSFMPTGTWQPLVRPPERDKQEPYNPVMAARFQQLVQDMLAGRLTRDSGRKDRAPTGTTFWNFDEAVRLHGRPIGPFEQLVNGRIEYHRTATKKPQTDEEQRAEDERKLAAYAEAARGSQT
jgi:hypothetical protein